MIDIFPDLQNLKSFQEAMATGETVMARGLWHGTSRALGGFRKEFLKRTPANIRGKNSANPRGAASAGKMPPIGRSFIWQVHPPTPPKARRHSSSHVKSVKQISGNIGTRSEAAESMEEGKKIQAKGPYLGIPIVLSGNVNAKKRRAGEVQPRAKPSWRTVGEILKPGGLRTAYNFQWQVKGSYTILWARHKKSGAKPFPVMLLIKRVQMKKDGLRYYKLWKAMKSETLERYDKEITKALKSMVWGINKRSK
jgi:hypothetical protein